MLHYQYIVFSDKEKFNYKLSANKVFIVTYNLGKWELFTPDGMKVAKCDGKTVAVYTGYMWDGSTIVGKFYEDEVTLEASLLHDVLYNAVKNPDNVPVNFTPFVADAIFQEELEKLYKKNGNWFQKNLFPKLYKWGLWTLGLPWKFGNNEFYRLKK